MKKLQLAVAFCATAAFCNAEEVPESGQNYTNNTESLPAITVEASRTGKTRFDMPDNVRIIGEDEIAASGASSVAELLKNHCNVFIRELNSNPTMGQVAWRGYGENSFGRILLQVDGEYLNNLDMEAPNLMRIPVDALSRVEIIRGPQTVLHGDNASAGVINFVTRGSKYDKKTRFSVKGGSYGTVGVSASTRGGFEDEGVFYNASGSFLDSDGYRENSGYRLWNVNGTVGKEWENGSFMKISVFYNDSDYELPGALSEAQYKSCHSPRMTGYVNEKSHVNSYTYGASLSSEFNIAEDQFLDFDAAFSHRMRHNVWDYIYYGARSFNHYDFSSYSYQFRPSYINRNRIVGFDNELIAGLDLRYDDYSVKTDSPWYQHSRPFWRFSYGVFARDEIYLTDELSVFGGVRFERFLNHTHDAALPWTNDNRNEAAYELGAIYRPLETMKLYVKGTRFYRAPFCDEMNYAPPGEALTPESGYSADAGVDVELAKEWNASFSVFHTTTDNEIFYNPYSVPGAWGWTGYNENSPQETRRNGFETSIGWSREKTGSVMAYYNYTDARFAGGGRYKDKFIPMVPRQTVGLRGEYYLVSFLAVNGGYRFIGEQRFGSDFDNAHGVLPCYSLFDAGARLEGWGVLKGFTLSFHVDNLFNRRYCDYALWSDWTGKGYYPGMGRSYMLTLAYEF